MLYFVEEAFYVLVNHSVSFRIFHVRCLISQMVLRVPLIVIRVNNSKKRKEI